MSIIRKYNLITRYTNGTPNSSLAVWGTGQGSAWVGKRRRRIRSLVKFQHRYQSRHWSFHNSLWVNNLSPL